MAKGVEQLTESDPTAHLLLQSHGIEHKAKAASFLCRYMTLMRLLDIAASLSGLERHPRISKAKNWFPGNSAVGLNLVSGPALD